MQHFMKMPRHKSTALRQTTALTFYTHIHHSNSHFPGKPGLACSPWFSVSNDHYPEHPQRSNHSISSLTQPYHVFFEHPPVQFLHLHQHTSLDPVHSTHPNHRNMPLLINKLTGCSVVFLLSFKTSYTTCIYFT